MNPAPVKFWTFHRKPLNFNLLLEITTLGTDIAVIRTVARIFV